MPGIHPGPSRLCEVLGGVNELPVGQDQWQIERWWSIWFQLAFRSSPDLLNFPPRRRGGGRTTGEALGGRLAVFLRGERAKRQGQEFGEGDVDDVLLLRVVDGAVALGGGRHGLAAAVARADLAAVEDARGGHDAIADEIPGALVLGLLLGPDNLSVGVRRGVRGDLVEWERRYLLDADEPA